MDFDGFTHSLTGEPPRRGVLRGLGGAVLMLFTGRDSLSTRAKQGKKHKNKKKRQPPPFNAFGCLDVEQPCRGNSDLCCSGICEGPKPKKGQKDTSRCVAHNAGFCSAASDSCRQGSDVRCSGSNPECACTLTTGNAGFCLDFTTSVDSLCRFCNKDTDCQAEFGPGSACLVLGGKCTTFCAATGGTACGIPCI
jgi:hypothetical protein